MYVNYISIKGITKTFRINTIKKSDRMCSNVRYLVIGGPKMRTWAVNSLLEMELKPIKQLFNLN